MNIKIARILFVTIEPADASFLYDDTHSIITNFPREVFSKRIS